MKIFGIIMAGGGGTRFWPLSRRLTPKQLLNLSGRDILLNEAAERLELLNCNDIFVVTNAAQVANTRSLTGGKIADANIFAEPCSRNTAACIGYAAVRIKKLYGDGVMVITPSDAYIRDANGFAQTLQKGIKAASEGDNLVTVGIEPVFPATGYGYIQYGGGGEAKKVLRFVEKPCFEKAVEYLRAGDYLWNSGMFVWKASVILREFREYLPEVYARLQNIYDAVGTAGEDEVIQREYPLIPSVSVDVGIMEKSKRILVIPGNFGWSDVGSWDMLGAVHSKDRNGNITVGDSLLIDCKNTTAYSGGRLVAALGVENLIIVDAPDAVMVCPADKAQDVKKIVERLTEEGREELL